ncbi:MAG TPA: LamG-like jellyroll fold domain-containing protein [Verrucomicrobiae bacterium]
MDSSGFNNDGGLASDGNNFPTWTTGQPGFGGALRFASDPWAHAFVDIPGSSSLRIGVTVTNSWSITAWAYEDSYGTSDFVSVFGHILAIDDEWAFAFYSGYSGYARMSCDDLVRHGFEVPWVVGALLDRWVHWALVYDGAHFTLYRNGNQGPYGAVETRPLVGALGFEGYTGGVRIGAALQYQSESTWNGMLDDIAVFRGALTLTEIRTIMQGDFSPYLGGPPHIVRQPESQTAQPGNDVDLSIVCQGLAPISYTWYHNRTNLLLQTSGPSLALHNVQPAQAGEYSVTATNALGVAFSENAVLIVNTNKARMVGLWRFDEGTGTNAADASGFNNHGTLRGEYGNLPAWVASHPGFGNALRFTNDGVRRAYVEIPGGSSLKIGQSETNAWSIAVWAYEDSGGFGDFQSLHGRLFVLDNGRALQFESGVGGDAQMLTGSRSNAAWQIGWGSGSPAAPLLDQWVHWTLVYSGASLTVYRNGNQGVYGGKATYLVRAALGYAGYAGSIRIGSELLEPMNYGPNAKVNWNGVLDDIAVFNTALTETEVRSVMSGNFDDFVARAPLSAVLGEGNVIVSWTALLPGARLQSTPSLSNPQWTDVPEPAAQRGAVFTVTLLPAGGARFFRLGSP